MGLDTKTYWLTDRQSQCDFDFDFDNPGSWVLSIERQFCTGGFEEKRYLEECGCGEKTLCVIFKVRNSVTLLKPVARTRLLETVIDWGH
jgi:hypothetical protein